MRTFSHIAPEQKGTSAGGGGGPEDPGAPGVALRTQGLLTLAFGLALGVALVVLVELLQWLNPDFATWVSTVNLSWPQTFLIGLVGGTIMAAIYNFLVLRRLNIFGLGHNL